MNRYIVFIEKLDSCQTELIRKYELLQHDYSMMKPCADYTIQGMEDYGIICLRRRGNNGLCTYSG